MQLKSAFPFLLAALVCSAEETPPSFLPKTTIVYTANVNGEIEPCGCREGPTGGIHRRFNALKDKVPRDKDILSLDSGDLFYKSYPVPPFLRDQWNYQAEVLVDAYNAFKVEVFTPGELDFAAGLSQFMALKARAKFKMISSNIQTSEGSLLLEDYAMFSKGGKKVAVFAVTDEEIPLPDGLTARPHIETAKAMVKKLRSKADVIIALTHIGYDKDKILAKEVPGIDAIFGAHTQSFLHEADRVGKTLIFQTSFRGQHLGAFDGANHMYQLDTRFDSEPGSPNPMDLLLEEAKKKIAKMNLAMDEKLMHPNLGMEGKKEYQTFVRCVDCHKAQYDFHKKSDHFHAFATLVKAKQGANLECLKCHTAGAQAVGGWQVPNKLVLDHAGGKMNVEKFAASLPTAKSDSFAKVSKAFINVQCENCHGPASEHPFSGEYKKAVSKDTCLACHTPDRAPKWYENGKPDLKLIEAKLKSLTCPASKD